MNHVPSYPCFNHVLMRERKKDEDVLHQYFFPPVSLSLPSVAHSVRRGKETACITTQQHAVVQSERERGENMMSLSGLLGCKDMGWNLVILNQPNREFVSSYH